MLRVSTQHELLCGMVCFAKKLGFGTTSAVAVLDHFQRDSEFHAVNSALPETTVLDDVEYNRRDPVMRHCKASGLPIVWDQQTYVSAGLGWRWEEQSRHGFHAGIALALHLPAGKHFFMAVDRDRSLPNDEVEVLRMVADLQLFAAYAHDAALRILLPAHSGDAEPGALTCRELETLRWTMEGKTAWEVGNILGISEQTAARHLHNASRKLDCVNKHHAVVKALRLGLIT